MKRIPVAQPDLAGNARRYVLDCLDTNWISSHGHYVSAFEEAFAKYCGVGHAIATNNGTSALHVGLVALGVGPGDEVIIPTVTYIATANAVRYCGATPVLVDVKPGTLNLDPEKIAAKITPRTRGIIPVHLYGHPAEMDRITQIARDHGLFVLEDAAEAHGAEYGAKKAGAWGECAAFSFFGNKLLTTGEGGMVTTDNAALAARLRQFRGQGMDPHRRYWFPVIGYNYRMTNIQAAIGLAQLETLEDALVQRRKLAAWYDAALAPLEDRVVLPCEEAPAQHVYWMYTILLRDADEAQRDRVMRELEEDGIETRPVFHPMHVLPPYREQASYPVADTWAHRGINLPTHGFVSESDVTRIAEALDKAISKVLGAAPGAARGTAGLPPRRPASD